MSFELLSAFLLYVFVGAITPGPNNMLMLASGLNYGIKPSIPHLLGISFGTGVMVISVGLGLLSILDYFPLAYHVLHVASVLYLLFLAWKIATAGPLHGSKNPKKKPMTFMQAVAFQWVNPKALILVMVAITTYVPESTGMTFILNISLIAIIDSIVSLFCSGAWLAFGSGFRRFLDNPLYYRIFNVTMAILLVLSLYPMLAELIK